MVTVTEVALLAVMVASSLPKCTAVAPPRSVPVMTTACPPALDPWPGEMGVARRLLYEGGAWTGPSGLDPLALTGVRCATAGFGAPARSSSRYAWRPAPARTRRPQRRKNRRGSTAHFQ